MSKKSQAARAYEDFQPQSEWREEPENYILTVHLPGFTKDQVNITCKRSSRQLVVQGERRLLTNKWSRFNQDYPIPQNCDLDKLDAWWQRGVLTVTMPKEEPKTAAEEAPVPSKETATLDLQPMKSSKDQQEAPAKPASFKAKNGEKKADHDQMNNGQKGRDHVTPEPQVDSTTGAMKQNDMQSGVTKSPSEKEKVKKDHETTAAAVKKSDEEVRKLMINMAVAMIVVVPLVAYFSYRLGSKAD